MESDPIYLLRSTPGLFLLLGRMPVDELVELNEILTQQLEAVELDILRVNVELDRRMG